MLLLTEVADRSRDRMNMYRLWLGLIAFSAGVVFFMNLNAILPYNPSPPLVETLLIEIVMTILIFGGLLLMYLASRQSEGKSNPKK